MKKSIIQLLFYSFILCFLPAFSQQKDSLIKDNSNSQKPLQVTAFAQFEGGVLSIIAKPAGVTGFGLNCLINHKFYVGARYQILSTPVSIAAKLHYPDPIKINLSHQLAVVNFGYIFFNEKRFSLNPEIAAGWCNILYKTPSNNVIKQNNAVSLISVNGIWNAHKNIRVGAGVGLKGVFGKSYEATRAFDYSGGFGTIFLRVGKF